jgi:hypothetical protein
VTTCAAACSKTARREVWLALFGGPGRSIHVCDTHAAALQGAGLRSVIEALELRLESGICGICGSPAEGFLAKPARHLGQSILAASFLCGPCFARSDLDKRMLEAASQR